MAAAHHNLLWQRLLAALKDRDALPETIGNGTPLEIARFADERLRTDLAVSFVEGYYQERRYGGISSRLSEAEAEALVAQIERLSLAFQFESPALEPPGRGGLPLPPREPGRTPAAEGLKPAGGEPVQDESQAWGTEYVDKIRLASRPTREAEEAERLRQEENARRAEEDERKRKTEQERKRKEQEEERNRRVAEELKFQEQEEEERKRQQEEENRKGAEERDRLWEESREQYQEEVRRKTQAVRQRVAEAVQRASEAAKASTEGRGRAVQEEAAADHKEAESANARSNKQQVLFQSYSQSNPEKSGGVSPAKLAWWVVLILLTPIYWLCAFIAMVLIGMFPFWIFIMVGENETVHRTMTLGVFVTLLIVCILIGIGLAIKSLDFFVAVFRRVLWEPVRGRIA